jgi:hypothetical protein
LAIDTLATGATVLTWTAPGDDGYEGRATEYDIRSSATLITASEWSEATRISTSPKPASAGSEQAALVSVSSSGSTYFGLRAADEASNLSELSNVVCYVAPPADSVPPSSISDLAVTAACNGTVSFAWTAPGDDGTAGQACLYDIRYATFPLNVLTWNHPDAVQLSNPPTPGLAGTVDIATITGLSPATSYYFAVRSGDEVPNWSGLSNSVSATTPPAPFRVIETFVGTGIPGFDGDGHPLLQSHLYWPIDLLFHADQRAYIVDWNNHRIRRVEVSGQSAASTPVAAAGHFSGRRARASTGTADRRSALSRSGG